MTSGQMAPTTLIGESSTTSPHGRDAALTGYPLKISEMLAQLPGVAYVTRHSVHKPVNVRKLKKAIKQALDYQKQGLGYCLIEVVTNCPSNMKVSNYFD